MTSPRCRAPARGVATQIAALQHRFGRVDVIENQTIAIPGSINTYDLRAQNPHGPFGRRCSPWSAGTTRPTRAR